MSGPCDWCGNGKCCRLNYNGSENGCSPSEGGVDRHECVANNQVCKDTPNWQNSGGGWTCADYAILDWCANGRITPGQEANGGSNWNYPEYNCCVCGKPAENYIPYFDYCQPGSSCVINPNSATCRSEVLSNCNSYIDPGCTHPDIFQKIENQSWCPKGFSLDNRCRPAYSSQMVDMCQSYDYNPAGCSQQRECIWSRCIPNDCNKFSVGQGFDGLSPSQATGGWLACNMPACFVDEISQTCVSKCFYPNGGGCGGGNGGGECSFTGLKLNKYISGTTGSGPYQTLDAAQAACCNDPDCTGVTLDGGGYSLRSSGEGLFNSPSGEVSWAKKIGPRGDECPFLYAEFYTEKYNSSVYPNLCKDNSSCSVDVTSQACADAVWGICNNYIDPGCNWPGIFQVVERYDGDGTWCPKGFTVDNKCRSKSNPAMVQTCAQKNKSTCSMIPNCTWSECLPNCTIFSVGNTIGVLSANQATSYGAVCKSLDACYLDTDQKTCRPSVGGGGGGGGGGCPLIYAFFYDNIYDAYENPCGPTSPCAQSGEPTLNCTQLVKRTCSARIDPGCALPMIMEALSPLNTDGTWCPKGFTLDNACRPKSTALGDQCSDLLTDLDCQGDTHNCQWSACVPTNCSIYSVGNSFEGLNSTQATKQGEVCMSIPACTLDTDMRTCVFRDEFLPPPDYSSICETPSLFAATPGCINSVKMLGDDAFKPCSTWMHMNYKVGFELQYIAEGDYKDGSANPMVPCCADLRSRCAQAIDSLTCDRALLMNESFETGVKVDVLNCPATGLVGSSTRCQFACEDGYIEGKRNTEVRRRTAEIPIESRRRMTDVPIEPRRRMTDDPSETDYVCYPDYGDISPRFRGRYKRDSGYYTTCTPSQCPLPSLAAFNTGGRTRVLLGGCKESSWGTKCSLKCNDGYVRGAGYSDGLCAPVKGTNTSAYQGFNITCEPLCSSDNYTNNPCRGPIGGAAVDVNATCYDDDGKARYRCNCSKTFTLGSSGYCEQGSSICDRAALGLADKYHPLALFTEARCPQKGSATRSDSCNLDCPPGYVGVNAVAGLCKYNATSGKSAYSKPAITCVPATCSSQAVADKLPKGAQLKACPAVGTWRPPTVSNCSLQCSLGFAEVASTVGVCNPSATSNSAEYVGQTILCRPCSELKRVTGNAIANHALWSRLASISRPHAPRPTTRRQLGLCKDAHRDDAAKAGECGDCKNSLKKFGIAGPVFSKSAIESCQDCSTAPNGSFISTVCSATANTLFDTCSSVSRAAGTGGLCGNCNAGKYGTLATSLSLFSTSLFKDCADMNCSVGREGKAAAVSSTDCQSCTPGRFSPGGNKVCNPVFCPAGYTPKTSEGAVAVDDCTPCTSGKYSLGNVSLCLNVTCPVQTGQTWDFRADGQATSASDCNQVCNSAQCSNLNGFSYSLKAGPPVCKGACSRDQCCDLLTLAINECATQGSTCPFGASSCMELPPPATFVCGDAQAVDNFGGATGPWTNATGGTCTDHSISQGMFCAGTSASLPCFLPNPPLATLPDRRQFSYGVFSFVLTISGNTRRFELTGNRNTWRQQTAGFSWNSANGFVYWGMVGPNSQSSTNASIALRTGDVVRVIYRWRPTPQTVGVSLPVAFWGEMFKRVGSNWVDLTTTAVKDLFLPKQYISRIGLNLAGVCVDNITFWYKTAAAVLDCPPGTVPDSFNEKCLPKCPPDYWDPVYQKCSKCPANSATDFDRGLDELSLGQAACLCNTGYRKITTDQGFECVDQQKPDLVCPVSLTFRTTGDNSLAKVVYNPFPRVTDNLPLPPGTVPVLVSGPDNNSWQFPKTTSAVFSVTDAAGLTTECTILISIVDGDKPNWIQGCPPEVLLSNTYIQSDENGKGVVAGFTGMTALDGVDGSVTSLRTLPATLPAGYAVNEFPVGTTRVSYQAKDKAGNTAVCTFNVTVNPSNCPPGTFSVNAGNVGKAPCTQCARGYYSTFAGSSTCQSCAIGYIAPFTGSTTCFACSEGTESATFGGFVCTPKGYCPPGTFSADGLKPTSEPCTACAAGKFTSMPATNASVGCTACPINTEPNIGKTQCVPCAADYATTASGQQCQLLGCTDPAAINRNPSAGILRAADCKYSQPIAAGEAKTLTQTSSSGTLFRMNIFQGSTVRKYDITAQLVPSNNLKAIVYFDGTNQILTKFVAAINLGPDGTQFINPVEVCLKVPSSYTPAGGNELWLIVHPENDLGTFKFLSTTVKTDPIDGTATLYCGKTKHFSQVAVVEAGAPINCTVGEWSNFTECNVPCGGGTQSRTRSIITYPSSNGQACPGLTQVKGCNDEPCPVDCVVGSFTLFSACSQACGGGVSTRTRPILVAPLNGGRSCGLIEEKQSCNTNPCPEMLQTAADQPSNVVLLSLQVDDSGSTFSMVWTGETDRAGKLLDISFRCSDLLDVTTLGNNPTCIWPRLDTLRVKFGGQPTILLGDTVRMKPGVIIKDVWGSKLTDANLQGKLSGPTKLPVPTPVIVGPQRVGGCAQFKLDSSVSGGNAGREYTKLVWTKTNFNGGITGKVEVGTTRSIILTSSDLIPKLATHRYKLTLENWMGMSASLQTSVFVDSVTLPTILVPASLYQKSQQDTEVNAVLQIDDFMKTVCGFDASFFTFTWAQIEGPNITIPASVLTAPKFYLPSETMKAGETYKFKVKASPAFDPASSSEATVTIVIEKRDLVAAISGGDREEAAGRQGVDVVLDGSSSYDPDDEVYAGEQDPNLLFTWSCIRRAKTANAGDQSVDCFDNPSDSSPALDLASAARQLNVKSTALNPDFRYTFTLKVQKDTRVSMVSVLIDPKDGVLPRVGIELKSVVDFDLTAWSAQARLELEASADNGDPTNSNDPVTLRWSQQKGNLDLDDKRVITTPLTGKSFVVAEDKLSPGVTYVFLVTATNIVTKKNASATFRITVNAPPSSGTCIVSPPNGTAYETEFFFECFDWTDQPIHYPLKYQFELVPLDTSERSRVVLSPYQLPGYANGIRLPGNDGEERLVIASIMDALGAVQEFQFTVALTGQVFTDSDAVNKFAFSFMDSKLVPAQFNKDLNGVGQTIVMGSDLFFSNPIFFYDGKQSGRRRSLQLTEEELSAQLEERRAARGMMIGALVDLHGKLFNDPNFQGRSAELLNEASFSPAELGPEERSSTLDLGARLLEQQTESDNPGGALTGVAESAWASLANVQQSAILENVLPGTRRRSLLEVQQEFGELADAVLRAKNHMAYTFAQNSAEEELRHVVSRGLDIAMEKRTADSQSKPLKVPGTGAGVTLPDTGLENIVNDPFSITLLRQPDIYSVLTSDSDAARRRLAGDNDTDGNYTRISNTLSVSLVNSSNGQALEVGNISTGIIIEIPHDTILFVRGADGEIDWNCNSVNGKSVGQLTGVDRDCDFLVESAFLNTADINTVREWDNKNCEYDFWASKENTTVCNCTHLTIFSVNPKDYIPRVNTLTLDSFRDLNPENVKENPATLIGLLVITGIWMLVMVIGIRKEKQRNKKTKEQISVVRERWIEHTKGALKAKTFAALAKDYKHSVQTEHLAVAFFTMPWGQTFTVAEKLTTLYTMLVFQMAIQALFYGTQTQSAAITISLISSALVVIPTEFLIWIFSSSGDIGPRAKFKFDVDVLVAEKLGKKKPSMPFRLPYWCKYVGWMSCILLVLTGWLLTLAFGMQFDLYHSTNVNWIETPDTFKNGFELGESYANYEECQKGCTGDPACTGISIRKRDCRCYQVHLGATTDPRFITYEIEQLYESTSKWIKSFVMGAALDIFLMKPLTLLAVMVIVYCMMPRVEEIDLSSIDLLDQAETTDLIRQLSASDEDAEAGHGKGVGNQSTGEGETLPVGKLVIEDEAKDRDAALSTTDENDIASPSVHTRPLGAADTRESVEVTPLGAADTRESVEVTPISPTPIAESSPGQVERVESGPVDTSPAPVM
eukprot:g9871.t1